jgi:hypothetical protein
VNLIALGQIGYRRLLPSNAEFVPLIADKINRIYRVIYASVMKTKG